MIDRKVLKVYNELSNYLCRMHRLTMLFCNQGLMILTKK